MTLSEKEKQILLVLFKEQFTWYNSRSISTVVSMTPRGALKALTKMENEGFVQSELFGRAKKYVVKWSPITKKMLELILVEESEKKYKRWVEEFKEFKESTALILFGSVTKRKEYKDVDLFILLEETHQRTIINRIDEKNKILPKKIHPLFQTRDDLIQNIIKKDKVILDILRTGILLKGEKEIVEVLEYVSNRYTS